jgi:hypothetical protein
VLAVYAGLNGFYLVCSQRLHPLPFQWRPILVHLSIGALTVTLVAVLRNSAVSPFVVMLKLGWFAIVLVVLMRWGGSDVERIRRMLRDFTAGLEFARRRTG